MKKTLKIKIIFGVLALLLLINFRSKIQLYKQIQTHNNIELVPLTSYDPNTFVSVWDTNRISLGSSKFMNQVRLPLESNGTYDFLVDWGDQSNNTITTWNQTALTHDYAYKGIFTIAITGKIIGWRFNNTGDRLKILEIQQWGCLQLGNSGNYFDGCENLNLTASDTLNLTGTTTLFGAFKNCKNLGSNGSMSSWDVSNVTNMGFLFYYAFSFNQDIGNWDVSSVTNMGSMFYHANVFNQYIDNWNISSVTNVIRMFYRALSFNQDIRNWDVSRLTDMRFMFAATSFNHDIGKWNVSNVTNMQGMFYAADFNQDIGDWDVSNVTNMHIMFYAADFNQDIGDWNVSSVTNMEGMFCAADSFNQDIGDWDVSSVTNMEEMFRDASSFNQSLGNWDVSIVTNMRGMFRDASSFNQPLDNWDVSNVTDMNSMFTGIILSTLNYDNLLLAWSQLSLQNGVYFYAGNSKYSSAATNARQYIIDTFYWTIFDGGLEKRRYTPRIPAYNLTFFIMVLGISIFVFRKLKINIK